MNPRTPFMPHPVPSRITMALDLTEAEGPVVDQLLGVAGPNGEDLGVVDLWEAGHLIPTVAQMVRLVECTHYPPKFFFASDVPEISNVFMCGPRRSSAVVVPAKSVEPWILQPKPGATTSTGEPAATLRAVEAALPRPPVRFSRPRGPKPRGAA